MRSVNEWGGQPLPLSATCWHDGACTCGCRVPSRAVAAAARRLGGEPLRDAAAFWGDRARAAHAFFARRRCAPSAVVAAVGAFDRAVRRSRRRAVDRVGRRAALAARRRARRRRSASRAWAHAQQAVMRRCSAAATSRAGVFHPLPPTLLGAAPARSRRRSIRPASSIRGRMYRGVLSMETKLADFIRDTPRRPRSRRDPARMRALRLLHGHLPDLSAARRRARRAARTHLPDQADARRRRGHRARRSCTSIAA